MPLDTILESIPQSSSIDRQTVEILVRSAYQQGFTHALDERIRSNPDVAVHIYDTQQINAVFQEWYEESPLDGIDGKIIDKLETLFCRTFELDYESINELIHQANFDDFDALIASSDDPDFDNFKHLFKEDG